MAGSTGKAARFLQSAPELQRTSRRQHDEPSTYKTQFGSLDRFEKGGVQTIDDDVKNYAFSNCFEIASKSKPYEKVVFGQNQIYVLECLRAEGTSPWYTCAHDEFALVMDGEVEIHLVKLQARADRARRRAQRRGAGQGRAAGPEDGLDEAQARPPGAAAEEHAPTSSARAKPGVRGAADLQGRPQRSSAGRRSARPLESKEQHHEHHQSNIGYQDFELGGFSFRRDEYFAHINWKTTRRPAAVAHAWTSTTSCAR